MTNGQLEKRTDWFRPVVEPEKDYDILSYSSKIDARVFPAEESFGHEDLQIYSVKRLSDGEVFTVREDSGQGKIVAFVIKWDSMFAQVNEVGFIGIGELIKQTRQPETKRPPLGLRPKWIVAEHRKAEIDEAMMRYKNAGKEIPMEWHDEFNEIVAYLNSRNKDKQPLFTTEDGVKIYDGDKCFCVYPFGCCSLEPGEVVKKHEPFYISEEAETISSLSVINDIILGTKHFSTHEAAEEYVLMNKPLLSVSVVLGIYKASPVLSNFENNIKYYAKQKLSE